MFWLTGGLLRYESCFGVAQVLGTGFLEKVYERALELELKARGLRVERQVGLTVYYKGEPAGNYFADLVVFELFAGCGVGCLSGG